MGKLALITGGTSGIGAAYSEILAKNGWDIVMTGRREELLDDRAQYLRDKYKVKVLTGILDFTNREAFHHFVTSYVRNYNFEFIVNSVGFSNRNDFFSTDFEINEKMITVHLNSMAEIIHEAIPHMKKVHRGHIVNVSSLVGFLPSLHDPFYSGTKSFINTYSESIALILKSDNIIIQSLCPGFTKTDFHKDMDLKDEVFKNRGLKRWMEAEDVVKYSYKKLKIGRVIVIPGIANRIVYYVSRMLPKSLYYYLAGKKKMLDEKK